MADQNLCVHEYQLLQSDNPTWYCNACCSGPNCWVFECTYCKFHICCLQYPFPDPVALKQGPGPVNQSPNQLVLAERDRSLSQDQWADTGASHPMHVRSHEPGTTINGHLVPPTPFNELPGYDISKRKLRASQACDQCRALKAKCNEESPCRNCKDRKLKCQYASPSKTKPSTDTQQVLDRLQRLEEILMDQTGCEEIPRQDMRDAPGPRDDEAIATVKRMDDVLARGSTRSGVAVHPDASVTEPKCTAPAIEPHTWPNIGREVGELFLNEGIECPRRYSLTKELERGAIRLYGRGEGTAAEHTTAETWGRMDDLPALSLEKELVWIYVESYLDNIQNMHPLIVPDHLRAMVTVFLRTVSDGAVTLPLGDHRPSKRQRRPAALSNMRRDPDTALVLTVLALGKICMHRRERLPDIASVETTTPFPFHDETLGSESASRSSGLPSPEASEQALPTGGSRASIPGAFRNLDLIPGLDYFAVACDIRSGLSGEHTLKLAWAQILASLYYGQLVRPAQSCALIADAGRTMQVLLQPFLGRLTPPETTLENLVCFAFWTCLQLEIEFNVELKYPQSGIGSHRGDVPLPNLRLASTDGLCSKQVAGLYMCQLSLVAQFRRVRHEQFSRLNVDNAPSKDILQARVRAAYWHSRVLDYGPIIHGVMTGTCTAQPDADTHRQGVRALVESTRAFHGLKDPRFIVTNIFGTAHMQFGNLLVLYAVSQDAVLSEYLETGVLEGLFQRTISLYKIITQPTSSLIHDMNILEGLARRLQSGAAV